MITALNFIDKHMMICAAEWLFVGIVMNMNDGLNHILRTNVDHVLLRVHFIESRGQQEYK